MAKDLKDYVNYYVNIREIDKITKREAIKLLQEMDEDDPQYEILKYRKYADSPFQYYTKRNY